MKRALLLLVLAGCTHGEVFSPAPHGTDRPLNDVTLPVRLTYNRGHDENVSWLPDGSGFLYTFERFRYSEGDWCVGLMPSTGGRLRETLCAETAGSLDSVDAWLWPSQGADSLLAFVRTTSQRGQIAPTAQNLMVVLRDRPAWAVLQMPMPYTIPGQPIHHSASRLQWLDDQSLVYRADLRGAFPPCQGCPPDTVASGRALVLIEMAAAQYTRAVIPGTRYASSLAMLGGDEVAYTRAGESVVYAWSRAHDTTRVLWDFGGGIARGLTIAGNRLVAIVGGAVSFDFSVPLQDSILVDGGGPLRVVDLATGDDGIIDQFTLYRNPVLSPDGRTLIVESVARAPDLFRFDLP